MLDKAVLVRYVSFCFADEAAELRGAGLDVGAYVPLTVSPKGSSYTLRFYFVLSPIAPSIDP